MGGSPVDHSHPRVHLDSGQQPAVDLPGVLVGLTQILICAAFILLYRNLFQERGRSWMLFAASIVAVFWLQPATPIRNLDFWLPLATLLISAAGWALTQPVDQRFTRQNGLAALILVGLILLLGMTRWLPGDSFLTASHPPVFWAVVLGLFISAGVVLILARFSRPLAGGLLGAVAALIILLLILKIPALAEGLSVGLRSLTGQSTQRASGLDIRWLGISYVAFRLIATLRDRQTGRLPAMTLQEYMTYVIFFPAFTAGPIDRPERFLKDLRAVVPFTSLDALEGGRRLVTGIFAKFVLADGLAFFALSSGNSAKIQTTGWLWVAVVAYSLRIYLDFSGYTAIAIGLARWLGIHLPENFNRPYLKPNLTQFWNNWHMTLTQWFRAYYFNPLTRALRSRKKPLPPGRVIFITQVTTMILIGLWHGGTVNFVIWGLWHGLGQFVQNRYSDRTRGWMAKLDQNPRRKQAYTVLSTAVTFAYVSLGWVWFVLPDPQAAFSVFERLVGLG